MPTMISRNYDLTADKNSSYPAFFVDETAPSSIHANISLQSPAQTSTTAKTFPTTKSAQELVPPTSTTMYSSESSPSSQPVQPPAAPPRRSLVLNSGYGTSHSQPESFSQTIKPQRASRPQVPSNWDAKSSSYSAPRPLKSGAASATSHHSSGRASYHPHDAVEEAEPLDRNVNEKDHEPEVDQYPHTSTLAKAMNFINIMTLGVIMASAIVNMVQYEYNCTLTGNVIPFHEVMVLVYTILISAFLIMMEIRRISWVADFSKFVLTYRGRGITHLFLGGVVMRTQGFSLWTGLFINVMGIILFVASFTRHHVELRDFYTIYRDRKQLKLENRLRDI